MSDIEQLPGELNITVAQGDDFSLALDFDIDLTGYTFVAKVKMSADEELIAMSVTETDLSAGQITLVLTDTQTAEIVVATHKWFLVWTTSGTSLIRNVLAGNFIVENKR